MRNATTFRRRHELSPFKEQLSPHHSRPAEQLAAPCRDDSAKLTCPRLIFNRPQQTGECRIKDSVCLTAGSHIKGPSVKATAAASGGRCRGTQLAARSIYLSVCEGGDVDIKGALSGVLSHRPFTCYSRLRSENRPQPQGIISLVRHKLKHFPLPRCLFIDITRKAIINGRVRPRTHGDDILISVTRG